MNCIAYPQPHATREALDTFAETNTLVPWQIYAIDDENGSLAVAQAPDSFATVPALDGDGYLPLPSGGGVLVGGQRVLAGRQAGISQPTGGTVEDAEARTAISQILAALTAHGLIE